MRSPGRVYRRCGCVDPMSGKALGDRCPRLAAWRRHRSWYTRLELLVGLDGRRHRICRGGYPTRKAALEVLGRLREPRPGDKDGHVLTVGDWPAHRLASRTSPASSTVSIWSAPR